MILGGVDLADIFFSRRDSMGPCPDPVRDPAAYELEIRALL